jgi:hypothetical protein
MARITTKAGLISRIKSQLGYPTINIEVSDTQMGEIIDDAIQKFTEHAYGTLEAVAVIQIDGPGTYSMPDTMTNVIKVSKGATSNITNFGSNFGSGYVPDLWSQQYFSNSIAGDIMPAIIGISNTVSILQKYFGDEIVYNFNHLSKQLQILENWQGPVALHYQYEYIAVDAGPDLIFNHEWIKEYTKAKTKELWSQVVGKYDQNLVGGAKINYEKLASEAESEINLLNEELLSRWSDPAPISIG